MIEEQLASILVSNALLVFQFQENLVISLLFISFFRDDLLLFLNHREFYDSSLHLYECDCIGSCMFACELGSL